MGLKTWIAVVGAVCVRCGAEATGREERLSRADAAKLPKTGQPVPGAGRPAGLSRSGEKFTETTSVRELAQEHQRKLMTELQAAVDGRPAPHVTNERTYTMDEVIAGLELEQDRGVYASPDGCSVQNFYFERGDVEIALDDPIRNNVVIASPKRRVGVLAYRPDRRCREGIARDLARLDAA